MIFESDYFDQLVSLSGDLFFVLDAGGIITQASSSVSQELGHPLEQAIGKPLESYLHSDDVLHWQASMKNAAASAPAQEIDLRVQLQKGTYATLHGRLQFLPQSKIFLVTLRKLSMVEQQLPQVLQKTLDRLNLSLRSANMGIWESHLPPPNSQLAMRIKWDPEMRRIHGVPEGLTPDPTEWFMKHVHPEDLPVISAKSREYFRIHTHENLHYIYRVCWPNGEIHHIDMYGSIEASEPGGFVKLFGVAKDITKDVLKRQLEADQKNRMISSSRLAVLGEISAGIAHEINNPLTVIQARSFQLAQMAENNVFDAVKVKAAADGISKTGDKIAKIVKSLRAFAQSPQNGQMDTVSVSEMIQETLDFCKVRFYNHGIDIRVGEIPIDLEIECRLIQIEEVLLNIFNNAHDAILELPERWILIEAFDRGENVHIQITDSGNCIREEIADKMMMPFFTTKTLERGLGLGLSIVTDIVEKHGGQLYLDRAHANTRFIVSLPKTQSVAN